MGDQQVQGVLLTLAINNLTSCLRKAPSILQVAEDNITGLLSGRKPLGPTCRVNFAGTMVCYQKPKAHFVAEYR